MIIATALLALGFVTSPLPQDSLLPVDAMMAELRKGGYTIVWRHTTTDQSFQDQPGFPNTPRYQQRNLSDKGVAEARAMGVSLKNRMIPVGEVLVSPMFRTREMAEYMFGRYTAVAPMLISMQPNAEEKKLIAAQPAAGTNRVLITHHFIIERNVPGIKAGEIKEGEAVVVKGEGEQIRLVGILKMKDLYAMHEQDGGAPLGAAPAAPPAHYVPLVIPASLTTERTNAVGEYLKAFNSGEPSKMRQFFEKFAIPNPNRTIEQRLESYEGLKTELGGTISLTMVDIQADNTVVINTLAANGKKSVLTFKIEPAAPYRMASLNFMTTGP